MSSAATCSVLYYPGQDFKFGKIYGHAELEFEDIVYTFGSGRQSENELAKRIKKSRSGGLPFEQFSLRLTREQSNYLKVKLKSTGEPSYRFDNFQREIGQKLFGERIIRILESSVENSKIPRSYTCMDYVSNILQEANIMQIPKIVKLSPLLSSIYLRSLRLFGDKRVEKIVDYGSSFSSLRNFLFVNCCRVGEIGILALPILIGGYYFLI